MGLAISAHTAGQRFRLRIEYERLALLIPLWGGCYFFNAGLCLDRFVSAINTSTSLPFSCKASVYVSLMPCAVGLI